MAPTGGSAMAYLQYHQAGGGNVQGPEIRNPTCK